MRSLPMLLVLLIALPFPAQARKIDCKKDLKKAYELVNDYWSFKLFKPGAYDLERMYKRLESAAKNAETPAECADVLARFMAHLHDGHSSLQFYPGLEYTTPRLVIRSQRERLSVTMGRDPKVHVYIYARDTVDASVKDITVGSELLEVDGRPIDELYAFMEARVSGSTPQWRDYRCDNALLLGPAGSSFELLYKTPGGARKTVTVERPEVEEWKEWRKNIRKEFDPQETYWKELDDGWGYIRYSSFSVGSLERTIKQFDEALDALLDAPGIVIDLRHNGGGYVAATTAIAGRFIDDDVTFGYFQVRQPGQNLLAEVWDPTTGSITARPRLLAEPRGKRYEGPLVILIDRACFSACETFTAGMKDIGRALVVGTGPSGGGSGFVSGLKLPSGAIISFSWTVAWRPGGDQIESSGVAPDIRVTERPRDWYARRDRVLARAIRALAEGEAPALAGLRMDS